MAKKRDQSDQSLLDEINDNFIAADDEWRDSRDEGADDMRYIAGQPWTADDLTERRGRPSLALDELNQYSNSLINDVRQNKRAIKVSAAGNGANTQTAEFRANKIREIEYRSHAQDAYTTAFANAVERGYGYLQITMKPVAPDSFDQDVWIEPILNPDLVTPDPSAIRTTFSDQRFCYVHEMWDQKEFKRTFKHAQIVDFDGEMRVSHSMWIRDNTIRLANYWKIKTTRRQLLLVQPRNPKPRIGSVLGLDTATQAAPIFADEISKEALADFEVKRESWREEESVCKYLTNGVEVLETVEWPGKYIPVVACLGKIIYLTDGGVSKRKILSLVRLAKGAYKLLCYYASTEAELVGMMPRAPYMAYEGSLSNEQMLEIVKATKRPVPVILVKPSIEGLPLNGPIPFPIRQPYEPPVQSLEIGKESARRSIQSAMGTNALPSVAQRRNEKSGVALQKMDESAARGSFHFIDHYEDTLRFAGVVLDDLISKALDTTREAAVMLPDDTPSTVTINDPRDPKSLDPSIGDHLVTISTGPSFDSEREAAQSFTDALIGTPQLAQILGPQKAQKVLALAVKLKDLGPIGDEIVKVLDPTMGHDGDPAQMQQQFQQLQGEHQQLMQAAQAMKQELETEQVKQRATLEKAKIDADKELELQRMKDATSIAVAKIGASAKGGIVAFEAENEAIALANEQRHEMAMRTAEASHEAAMSEAERQHATELATIQAQQPPTEQPTA